METKTATVEIQKPDNETWDKSFDKLHEAMNWAVATAPMRYCANLIDIQYIIKGIQKNVK